MARFDLDDYKTVKLAVSPDMSQKIAELRAEFYRSGCATSTLNYVVEEAIGLLHRECFSHVSPPVDADRFRRTAAK